MLLSSSSSSYELRFSRIRRLGRTNTLLVPGQTASDEDTYNPHEDEGPYSRHVLRQGSQLASSLSQLIQLLRDNLPLVCAVDAMRREAEAGKDAAAAVKVAGLDFYPKAAGWYRISYGDSRYVFNKYR